MLEPCVHSLPLSPSKRQQRVALSFAPGDILTFFILPSIRESFRPPFDIITLRLPLDKTRYFFGCPAPQLLRYTPVQMSAPLKGGEPQ
jgi:hypothetical protein